MKLYLLLFCQLFVIGVVFAQQRTSGMAESGKVKIKGIVTDKTTQSIIAGARIQLLSDISDEEKTKDAAFTGNVITGLDGTFEFNDVPFAPAYTIIVTTVGYKALQQQVTVSRPTGNTASPGSITDVGILALEQDVKTLENVTVTATKPSMQFGIDRKIFNVEKSITAQGGTAVDVMRNIPSLTVDVNGNVEMRNTSPQIFVDGRPTILTLDQIPADDIERVELLTNPSSKYDASSAGGIINVVLKKNKRKGFNGLASVGGGTPGVLNGNLSLNVRQRQFNFFGSVNYNRSGGATTEKTFRQNKDNGNITDYFNQVSDNNRTRRFNSVRFGADYYIDDKNTVTFTQGFTRGRFRNNETQNQDYLDAAQVLDYTGLRFSDGASEFSRNSSSLIFDHVFERPDKKLTLDVTYNSGSRNSATLITTQLFNPDGSAYQPDNVVRNAGSGKDKQFTAQLDYTNTVNENKKVEFGLRTYLNDNNTTFGAFSVDQSNGETKLPLSNNYKYRETVNAGYFNYANKINSFKYQVGLRVEMSKLDGEMIDSAFKFGYSYPDKIGNIWSALFPSFFLTKQLTETQDIQFNYSKRIRRPRFWEVNPFVDINDPLNISQGNPALTPEYVHSFELNYFNRFKEGSFLGVLYFRNNGGDITEYSDTISPQLYQQLSNAGVSPNAILNTFINAGYTNRMGAEFTVQRKFFKELDLTYNLNLQYRETNAQVNKLNLSNTGFNYNTKLIAGYKIQSDKSKLFNNLSFQLVAEYESPRVIPQGKTKSQFVSDFALRKEFLKNKAGALSISVNDIFNTRRFGSIYDTERFYQDSYSRWSVRTFRVTFSYKFGNADFDLFGKRRGNGGDGGSEG
ncbi:outer membrane beta-barrel family protein [Foetidibacter luteolus]|uniref:outer membrane beta-barrel family protein n=1 Tax=Foetidibacter luteolus TaxID=2608880 RepID=UPI00129AF042|nr:outer membrane beta-barrel family protein [Foetidibacter luteolus]